MIFHSFLLVYQRVKPSSIPQSVLLLSCQCNLRSFLIDFHFIDLLLFHLWPWEVGRLGTAGTNKNAGIKPNIMGYHWILFWVSPTNINIYHHDMIDMCFHKNGGTIIF
jgi:hypothetical protein